MSQNTAHAIGTAAAGAIAGFGFNNRSAGLDMLSDADGQFDDNASSYQDIQAYEDQCEQQCEMQKSNCLNN
ncbi:MAG: hypothetical protein PHH11_15580 [Methylomonas sp.]|nr:hypothetical protein [Methylomonas sp.]